MGDSPQGPPEDLLSSWKEIAVYLDTTVRTVQRWEAEAGLPVRRLLHKRKASVYAYKSEIEEWRLSRDRPAPDAAPPEIRPEPPLAERPTTSPQRRGRFRTGLIAGALLGGVLFALAGYRWGRGPMEAPRSAPLTALPGIEVSPVLSPDGTKVAFLSLQPGQRDFDIYIADLEEGNTRAVTKTDQAEVSPTWSRDGKRLAFLRIDREGRPSDRAQIVVLDVATGREQVVARPGPPRRDVRWLPESYLAWTADESGLLMTGGVGDRRGIYRYDFETANVDRLTVAPSGSLGDVSPNLSPDGKLLTFVRKVSPFLGDVYVIDLTRPDGAGQRLTTWGQWAATPTFTPDGSEIIVSAGEVGGDRALWALDPQGARQPRRILLSGEDSYGLTLAALADGAVQLVFARGVVQTNIWRASLSSDTDPARIVDSSRIDANPAVSQDGSRLAFLSNRSGRTEVWTSAADGSGQRQLTQNVPPPVGAPDWSPDSSKLLFAASVGGVVQLFVATLPDGAVLQLTDDEGDKLNPRWSADGEEILFRLCRRGNATYTARVAASGGVIERHVDGPGRAALMITSPSGQRFVSTLSGRLMRLGEREPIRQRLLIRRPDEVRGSDTGIVFLPPREPGFEEGFYLSPYSGGRPELLVPVEEPWFGMGIGAKADALYYSRVEKNEFDLHLARIEP